MQNPNSKECVDCSLKYCMPDLVKCTGVPENKIPHLLMIQVKSQAIIEPSNEQENNLE